MRSMQGQGAEVVECSARIKLNDPCAARNARNVRARMHARTINDVKCVTATRASATLHARALSYAC